MLSTPASLSEQGNYRMNTHPTLTLAMDFHEKLAQLRKQRNLTQAALADAVEVHVTQIRRYEAGNAQPTLDTIRRLAIALSTSADTLVFPNNDRGPHTDLNLHLEAINQLDPDEQQTIRHLIEGALLRHQAKKLAS